MQIKMLTVIKEEHDIRALYIKVPVVDGDMPKNFPGRVDGVWTASIDVEKSKIQGHSWPTDITVDLPGMAEGLAALLNEKGERVLTTQGPISMYLTINPDGTIEGGIKDKVLTMVNTVNDKIGELIGDELE